jgi:hypothetical protein
VLFIHRCLLSARPSVSRSRRLAATADRTRVRKTGESSFAAAAAAEPLLPEAIYSQTQAGS